MGKDFEAVMGKTRRLLVCLHFATSIAACVAPIAGVSAFDRGGREHWVRSNGPPGLGPWIPGVWDPNGSYVGGWGSPGWRVFGPDAIMTAQYPWGYTAPYVRAGRVCVGNLFATNGVGILVRYQKVRPAIYCEPD